MINQYVIDALIEDADDSARMLVKARRLGEVTEDGMVREIATLESAESSCRTLAEVARLLNSDGRLRDALAEARDRAAADRAEAEYIAYTGTDAFLAEMVAEQHEPDLTPPDAQDDEAGEVTP